MASDVWQFHTHIKASHVWQSMAIDRRLDTTPAFVHRYVTTTTLKPTSRERERERERASETARERKRKRDHWRQCALACVCVCVREKERMRERGASRKAVCTRGRCVYERAMCV